MGRGIGGCGRVGACVPKRESLALAASVVSHRSAKIAAVSSWVASVFSRSRGFVCTLAEAGRVLHNDGGMKGLC